MKVAGFLCEENVWESNFFFVRPLFLMLAMNLARAAVQNTV